jgi:hypothetical protein
MISHKYNWFPAPQIHQLNEYFFPTPVSVEPPVASIDKAITPYTKGVSIFSDRTYCDTVGDQRLEGTYILQIPRHTKTPIKVELHREVKVFRLLTESNDNTVFKDWNSTDIKVGIRGKSCVHTTVVSKTFSPGVHYLKSGGPVAASPILIGEIADTNAILPVTILNKEAVVKSKAKSH